MWIHVQTKEACDCWDLQRDSQETASSYSSVSQGVIGIELGCVVVIAGCLRARLIVKLRG